ncbi:MAG: NUDIX domain-containing protein [Anaerolineales bacterium]
MVYTYDYPRPMLTVDVVLWRQGASGREVLLIERKYPPFAGRWALPGGFVEPEERLAHAALRELREETGVAEIEIRQLAAFGAPGRDPRGWTVSVVFYGRLPQGETLEVVAGDDAADAAWWPWGEEGEGLPPLAFDHAKILQTTHQRITEAETQNLASLRGSVL